MTWPFLSVCVGVEWEEYGEGIDTDTDTYANQIEFPLCCFIYFLGAPLSPTALFTFFALFFILTLSLLPHFSSPFLRSHRHTSQSEHVPDLITLALLQSHQGHQLLQRSPVLG